MAKKKDKVDGSTSNIEDILMKKYGADIIVPGSDIVDSKKIVIPVSPLLDRVLGGGIPEGSFVVFTGPPKCGKTTTAIDFAGTAQLPEYDSEEWGPRTVYILNIEGRLKSRDLKGIRHLVTSADRLKIVESKPGKILNAEDYLDIAERLINEKPGCLVIIDSFSALCTSGERNSEIGDRYRADAPVMLAKFCRRISNVVPINKSIVIGITHLIANQGQGHAVWSEASGRKIQYQADVKLKCTYSPKWEEGGIQIGQLVNWICETSAIGPPGGGCESRLRYNYGLDKEAEIIDICSDLGIIEKSGSWYNIQDEKVQGAEKACMVLKNNKKLYKEINDNLRTMLDYPSYV